MNLKIIPGYQTWIGFVGIKSSPVYFYVQRQNDFQTKNVPIPFEFARLNAGGAMDLHSGIFTAPRPGTYFFSFSAISQAALCKVGLFLNGKLIGTGHAHEIYETLSLQSTLHLKEEDKVSLQIFSDGEGHLDDHGNQHISHFTGWLLQEDLIFG